jgi:hypothetical protein
MTAKKVKIPLRVLWRDRDKAMVERNVAKGIAWVEDDNYCTTHRIAYVPIKEFSPRQRELFEKFTAAYDQENPGDKLLSALYSMGAKQDLSNVELGFISVGGAPIGIDVKPESGTPGLISSINAGSFALIPE